jgi:pilus assembly protein Flp/PilA
MEPRRNDEGNEYESGSPVPCRVFRRDPATRLEGLLWQRAGTDVTVLLNAGSRLRLGEHVRVEVETDFRPEEQVVRYVVLRSRVLSILRVERRDVLELYVLGRSFIARQLSQSSTADATPPGAVRQKHRPCIHFKKNKDDRKMNFVKNFIREENGADMVEYALLVALIAIAAVTAMTNFGAEIGAGFDNLKAKVNANVTTK